MLPENEQISHPDDGNDVIALMNMCVCACVFSCVMEPRAPFRSCTPHSAWQPLYSRSHSNSTRSTNEKRGLGRKEDGRVSGGAGCRGVGGGGGLREIELNWCSKTLYTGENMLDALHVVTYMQNEP